MASAVQTASAHASGVYAATAAALAAPDPLATATPTEKQAVTEAGKSGAQPIRIAGKVVQPSTLGAGRPVAAGLSDLPAPLLAALSLIVLLGLGAIVFVLVPRVRDRRKS